MRFLLGTHLVHWLGELDVRLFVSRNRLKNRKTLSRARAPWALDSGGSPDTQMCLTYWCRRFRSLCARVATGVWARSSSYT